ncbi:MAG: phosphoribosyltransferase family protein [Hydrogenothermaceae bacterium]|nr:phosphoribosyltransferase family protein [Hydrogenothermaceae bacterium]
MIFRDREEAGKLLSKEVRKYNFDRDNSIILAIPRGGVPVAYQLSKELNIPFSLVITKKLAPLSDPEAAFGAIATDGSFVVDNELKRYMGISDDEFQIVKEKALREAQEKEKKYLKTKPELKGKDVIIVDDGIATGYTAIAAAKYVKKQGAKSVILAVPVCPSDSIHRVLQYFDDVICYHKVDSYFFAVGAFYEDFHQVEDSELFQIIKKAEEEGLYF